jgi:hypothetical protein
MSKRLRAEDITVKPRIYMDGATFRVEYYGPITKGHCGAGFPTLTQAVDHANNVARRNPEAIKAINRKRFWERQARIANKAGMVLAA